MTQKAPHLKYKMQCYRRQRNPLAYANADSPRQCCRFSCQFVMPCAAIHIGVTPKRHIKGTPQLAISPPLHVEHSSIEAVNSTNSAQRQTSISPVSERHEDHFGHRPYSETEGVSPLDSESGSVRASARLPSESLPTMRPRALDKALPERPVPRTPQPSIVSNARMSNFTMYTDFSELYSPEVYSPEEPIPQIPEAYREQLSAPPRSRDDIDSTLLAEAMSGFGSGVDIAGDLYPESQDTNSLYAPPPLRRSSSTAFEHSRLPAELEESPSRRSSHQQHSVQKEVQPPAPQLNIQPPQRPSSEEEDVGMMDLSVLGGGPDATPQDELGATSIGWSDNVARAERIREHQEYIRTRREAKNRAEELQRKWRTSRTSSEY